ncbi:LacI family DNA-binding transcriptional regulator [Cupriavidus sp. AU9028]|uniref:LacI family DNA-binding transcriptional regulator n=1 Tax=Cupriavidus sp. AU9028 TaxID=2871157 RepID=UPI001C95FF51|nr:substrate-binding domain-containing protein [Cupriavidus sp. AU9028]MBY4897141.1 substrate-binding domain-containing protein [Cupriavidus sp. AU9028]
MPRRARPLTSASAPANGTTLMHVAEAAKVSLATASRVFGNPELVRQDTAERVLRAAEELGFRPNLLGAKLRAQRTRIVGVMLPTLENAVFAECWRGIEEAALTQGYSLMLVTSDYDPQRERERIEYLLRHRVDGMVLTVADAARSAVLDQLDAEGVPYVLAYNQAPSRGKRHSVSVDNRDSARAGVEALIAAGHRRIAVVSGSFVASDRARQRHAGYEDAMRAHGLQALPPLSLPGHTPTQGPAELECIRRLVSAARAPTALFCTNDMLAIGVIAILKRLGMAVPGDISVMGYDGIALGNLMEPPLSTVVQPNTEIGARALATLVARLNPAADNSDRGLPRTTLLPHTMRAGATVAPPP